ncbi:DUF2332 domain-containing protein [Arthrobacter sp. BE255]|uniref:DUF2332 domain-containing protein n=1 Tax=Arthrobacter sp. BE255 TaxID=2817721 RepID=UPI00285CD285|nr:DUF2332 domain-containing protein [Arthrobacter sp. BE255]MDR7161659.1 hypothetical protein [Arthrobacter sp. BE255]
MPAGQDPQPTPGGTAVPAGSRTAAWYRHFGSVEAPGSSPCYAEWTLGIADDPQLIARIDRWPHHKRQPNLLLAAARFLGAEPGPFAQFRDFLEARWDDVSSTVLTRSTQTNEAGRCATLLPSLAAISVAEAKPLALLEVGASAGLALYPDRYGYEYDDGTTVSRLSPGPDGAAAAPVLKCVTSGAVPVPAALPPVVWRAGVDLNPLDVGDPDDVAWLEALVWPEQEFRRARLRQAVAIARQDPPLLVAGDLNEQLLDLAAQAPADTALVVFHSAVMGYLTARGRAEFRQTMLHLAATRGVHWLSNEGHMVIYQEDGSNVVPEVDPQRIMGRFLLTHNGHPVAITGPHGQSLEWL